MEGIALDVHRRYGFDDCIDAFDLAGELGLSIRWDNARTSWRGGRALYIPARARIVEAHEGVAHETAHFLIDEYGAPQNEPNARRLAAALLAPRRAIDRELRRGWNLHRVMAQHPNASAELLGRRMHELRHGSGFAVWERAVLRYRRGPAAPEERALVAAAMAGAPARRDDLTGAWPIGERGRVLVLTFVDESDQGAPLSAIGIVDR
jgi:hypothetical protein